MGGLEVCLDSHCSWMEAVSCLGGGGGGWKEDRMFATQNENPADMLSGDTVSNQKAQ